MTLPLRIELAMTFKAGFPDVLARDRSGHGRPEASEAVSGRNILILPIYASVLGAAAAACQTAENHQFSPWRTPARPSGHFDLGLGAVIALALWSANSAGTENAPVLSS